MLEARFPARSNEMLKSTRLEKMFTLSGVCTSTYREVTLSITLSNCFQHLKFLRPSNNDFLKFPALSKKSFVALLFAGYFISLTILNGLRYPCHLKFAPIYKSKQLRTMH